MLAMRKELPMEDAVARLEPRVASIEADVAQLNVRVANVGFDLRDFRKSSDQEFEAMEARIDARFEDMRFALLIALLSVTVTLAAVVLGVLLSGRHGA
jgi:hypothetical protein